jgi:hypothetical protein
MMKKLTIKDIKKDNKLIAKSKCSVILKEINDTRSV